MKKTFIATLLVLSLSVVSIFALDGFTFYTGVGFDTRSVSPLNNNAKSLEIEVGGKYALGDGFNVYGDLGIRVVGKGSASGNEIKKGFFGTNIHVGLLYGMRFVNSPEVEAYIGGGLSFAKTQDKLVHFENLGVGIKCTVAYRIKENFAIALSDHTDVYFLNSTEFKVGFGNSITFGAMYKF